MVSPLPDKQGGMGGRSQSAQGRQSFLYRGEGGTQSTCCGYSHPRHFFAPCQKRGGGGELGWGRGRASPWQMKHGTQLPEA